MAGARIATAFAAVARRGYASASAGAARVESSGSASRANMWMKKAEEANKGTKPATSWVPDPVTGYYKPEGQVAEVDAVELRNLLLKHKN